jgi:hypothetical protein
VRLENVHYQPQQSVLKPHSGQRQTACIRYISALPQRSQIILSTRAGIATRTLTGEIGRGIPDGGPSGGWEADGVRFEEETGCGGSGIGGIIAYG